MNDVRRPAGLGPLMIDVAGTRLTAEDREVLLNPSVGGLILFSRNYENRDQLRALCDEIAALPREPLLLAVDHEGGRVQRFREGFTRVPPMRPLGEQYQDDAEAACQQARHWGSVIAEELSVFGIDLCFAPVLDRDCGISGVIGDRAFSDDAQAITALAAAFRRGLRHHGLAATGKHFPGHGAVAADSHAELPVDERPLDAIRAQCLPPFAGLIGEGLESIMMAHVLYPQVDRLPASLSPRWIQQILRQELGFSGAVVCDDLSMNGALIIADPVERLRAALDAGCDMVPVCNDRPTVEQLLAAGPWTIDDAAQQRLRSLRRQNPAAPSEQQVAS